MSAAGRLNEIEARANAATEGPWVTGGTDLAGEVYFGTYADPDDPTEPGVMLGVTGTQEDAALIAHARTDVPWLIEQVRKRDAALQAVLDLHREARNDVDRTPPCPHCHGEPGVHDCGCWADEKWPTVCAVCMEGTKGASVAWPCPTVRVIEKALS